MKFVVQFNEARTEAVIVRHPGWLSRLLGATQVRYDLVRGRVKHAADMAWAHRATLRVLERAFTDDRELLDLLEGQPINPTALPSATVRT